MPKLRRPRKLKKEKKKKQTYDILSSAASITDLIHELTTKSKEHSRSICWIVILYILNILRWAMACLDEENKTLPTKKIIKPR